MDDQPNTPDSEHTIRPSNPAFQPLHNHRMWELSDRKLSIRGPSGLNPAASPFKIDSLSSGSTPQTTTHEDHPSQLHRSATTAQSQSNDPDDNLSCTFLPPDSPDLGLDPEGNNPKTMHTSSSGEYIGITMAPGQLGNLTTYGALAPSTHPSEVSGEKCDSSSGDDLGDLPFTPISARGKSNPNSTMTTPGLNQWPNHDHSGGVSLYGITSQTKTFTELSREQGLRDWNNEEFDNRWMLQADELRKRDDSRLSTLNISPEGRSSERLLSERSNLGKNKSLSSYKEIPPLSFEGRRGARNNSGRDAELLRQQTPTRCAQKGSVKASGWELGAPNKSVATLFGNEEDDRFVPLPQEEERFNALVREFLSGEQPSGLAFSPKILRRYFYGRCFGNDDGPAPLSDLESNMMTKHCGRRLTLARYRHEMLGNIEDLISYLVASDGKIMSRRNATSDEPSFPLVSDQLPFTPDSTNNILPSDKRQSIRQDTTPATSRSSIHKVPSVHKQGEEKKSHEKELLADLQQLLVQADLCNHNTNQTSIDRRDGDPALSADIDIGIGSANFTQMGARPQGPRTSVVGMQNSLSSAIGRFKLKQIDEEPSPCTANGARPSMNQFSDDERFHHSTGRPVNRFDGSSSNEASQSVSPLPSTGPWSSLHTSLQPTPYQSPEKPQYGGFPPQQYFQPAPSNFFGPGQAQNFGQQQMQYGTANSMHFPYGQQQQSTGFIMPQGFMSGNYCGPNGIWVPRDRYARPPATNRVAPRLAQPNLWQVPPQGQASSLPHYPEWQSRFGSPAPGLSRDDRKLPYLQGSDDMYPQTPLGGGASIPLQNLTRVQPPSLDTVKNEANLPFVETARASKPAEWGVMKIDNIPYDVSKTSITQFLGNHAKIITPELGPSVHIIMDRATGKTQRCYVEFFSMLDARAWVNLITKRSKPANSIGDRVLEVQLSSQDELLKELFPKAKNVSWEGGKPIIVNSDDPYNSGFKNFVSPEELQMLARHAEQPHRSNYTIKCPGRPYEAMISLLAKFPWHATENYTLALRNKIFDAALKMLSILNQKLRSPSTSCNTSTDSSPIDAISPFGAHSTGGSGYNTPGGYANVLPRPGYGPKNLDVGLLRDLLSAALNAAGFSEKQRWALYHAADFVNLCFLISPLAQQWPFEVLGRKRGMEEDVVEWYFQLFVNHPLVLPSASGSAFGDAAELFRHVKDTDTMDAVGEEEWNFMVRILIEQCS